MHCALGIASQSRLEYFHVQIVNPEVKDTPEAPKQAEEKLKKMGSLSRDETIMSGTMFFAVLLWIFGDTLGVPAVVAAMLGLCVLLLTGVLKWGDCLEYRSVPSLCSSFPSLLCTLNPDMILISLAPRQYPLPETDLCTALANSLL